MTARKPKPLLLPPPNMVERAEAARAARIPRAVIADPTLAGTASTMFIDYSRPRRSEQITTWSNLPGLRRINGTYHHDCLPGWQYTCVEVQSEMIPDLELFAERGVRPTEVTA